MCRPSVYYDSDCGFCRWALAWLIRWDRRGRLRPVAIASAEGERALGDLGDGRFDEWHFGCGADRYSGGRALAPLLRQLPGGRPLAVLARRLEFVTVPGYRWVARHRSALSRLVPARSKVRADAVVAERARRVRETA